MAHRWFPGHVDRVMGKVLHGHGHSTFCIFAFGALLTKSEFSADFVEFHDELDICQDYLGVV